MLVPFGIVTGLIDGLFTKAGSAEFISDKNTDSILRTESQHSVGVTIVLDLQSFDDWIRFFFSE